MVDVASPSTGTPVLARPKARLTPLGAVLRLAREPGPHSRPGVPELHSSLAASISPEGLEQAFDGLARNSITTVEELLGLAYADPSFLHDLQVPGDAAATLRNAFAGTDVGRAELQDWDRFAHYEYATGFDLRETPEPSGDDGSPGIDPSAQPVAGGALNLAHACMFPIRDQQDRGTCTAFASVACLEHYLCRTAKASEPLSEQFQYWSMVMSTGAQSLVACFPLLKSTGVCRATTWPYYGKQIPGNDAQSPPPPAAAAEAAAFRCGEVTQLPPRSPAHIQAALRNDQVVAIGIPVYRSWFQSPVVRKYGNITMPVPGEVPENIGHAVALVGFGDDPDFAGGGFFIVRNSWDHLWGTDSVFGSGYGTIPYAYIQRFNWDAWCITR